MADVRTYLAYPLHMEHGMVATSPTALHIREMIEQVIFTMPGERVMYPTFGVGLERLLFGSTAGDITAATQTLISAALHEWLGDVISVRSVTVDAVESTINVVVSYELLATHEIQRVVFER